MTNLEHTIALHRSLYRDELDFSPSQRTPPVAYHYKGGEMVPDDRPLVINALTPDEIIVPDEATQSTHVGMPMSSRMYRYLAGPSPQTPWSAALASLRSHCRKNHPYHRGPTVPYWRGSLCHQLVYMTVVTKPLGGGPATITEAAQILRYDAPEPVLRAALEHIERTMDDYRVKQEKRAREDAGKFTIYDQPPTHHAVEGLHETDCAQCRKKGAA